MMNVKELIEALEKMPQDAIIAVWNKETWEMQAIDNVKLDMWGNVQLEGR